jgi:hypothetical protein
MQKSWTQPPDQVQWKNLQPLVRCLFFLKGAYAGKNEEPGIYKRKGKKVSFGL